MGLLPFRGFKGGEFCADYKLIIVLIVIDEKFLRRKKYDLPIHPYIFALSYWNTMEYGMYRGCFNMVVYTSFVQICDNLSAKYELTHCKSGCFLIVSIDETICFF